MTTTLLTRPRTLSPEMETLRRSLIAAGWSAESPEKLSDEGEQLARDEAEGLTSK